jgi:phospholipase C
MTNEKKPDLTSSKTRPESTEQQNENSQHREDRRRFIQSAALGAAALSTGALNPLEALANTATSHTGPNPSAVKPDDQPKFDYVVVLMMEHRSFDHMLGRLYSPENPRPTTSLRGARHSTVLCLR